MSRIMPERWFYGATGNLTMSGVTEFHGGERRALAPGEYYLGAFIVPSFQRKLVWTENQKVRLIESIYSGMPIGSIVWNQTKYNDPCDLWLLDGQQRINTICEWLDGKLKVCGWYYPDLPQTEKQHFQRISISSIETRISDETICRDIYDRLVYGGTPHDPK